MRTFAATLLIFAVLAAPALAQQQEKKTRMQEIEEQRRKDQAEIDRTYSNAPQRLQKGDPQIKVDPWANIRPSNSKDRK
jgi:hypothetical protein